MKYVVVPSDVPILDRYKKPVLTRRGSDDEPMPFIYSHADFVEAICSHPALSRGGAEGARRQKKIREAFETCKPGDVVGVEDADFKVVQKEVLDHLTWHEGFAPYVQQILSHFEAWEAAERQDLNWKRRFDEERKRIDSADEVQAMVS